MCGVAFHLPLTTLQGEVYYIVIKRFKPNIFIDKLEEKLGDAIGCNWFQLTLPNKLIEP